MICKYCKKEFEPYRQTQVYCSQNCLKQDYRNNHASNHVEKKICPVCLEEFQTYSQTKVFCCPECYSEYQDIAKMVCARIKGKIKALIKQARETKLPLEDIYKQIPKK
jgi:protein-arginine kinase activator protein McsA